MFAVVSGGSRGIGRAVVEKIASTGAKVLYTYYQKKTILSKNIIPVRVDCTKEDEVRGLANSLHKYTDKIDILVNNLGKANFALLANQGIDKFNEALEYNLFSSLLMAKYFLPHMQKGGVVVNIGSLSSRKPQKGDGTYSIAKSLLESLNVQISLLARNHAVKVCMCIPGIVLTDVLKTDKYQNLRQANLASIPLKRIISPEEVAEIILSYVSSGWSGANPLIISGGQHLT